MWSNEGMKAKRNVTISNPELWFALRGVASWGAEGACPPVAAKISFLPRNLKILTRNMGLPPPVAKVLRFLATPLRPTNLFVRPGQFVDLSRLNADGAAE